MRRRVRHEFLDWKDQRHAVFSLTQIPTEVTWGPKTERADLSGYLCWWNVPAKLWVTGYIAKLLMTAETREPIPRVVLTLDLLREVDQVGLERCMDRAGCIRGESRLQQRGVARR